MTDKKTIEKTKLIKLLSSFSALEWKRFGRLVQSPYFNTNQQAIDFYTYLKKAFPFDDLKLLEQERIFKKIYKKSPFKLNQFQKLCSELYQLACDFVIDVHLQKEKRKRDKVLIDALSERNYELFKGVSQQLIKEVETQDYFLDEDDFLLLHQLNNELHHHIETDTFKIQSKALEKTWANLVAFYEATKFQLEAENKAIQNMLNRKRELKNTDGNEVKNLFKEATKLHKTKQTDLYFQLKAKILKNWHQLKTKHKTNLLVHLLNFTFTNELIQKKFGYKEALKLYKIGVNDKLFIINGKMREVEFVNIGVIGFALKENDWTENFIENHQQYLPKEQQHFLISLTYAYKANFQKNHELVIELLSQLNPTNQLRYLIKIKNLLIRAYFEGILVGKEEYRLSLVYEFNAMQKRIERNEKFSDIKKEANTNFLKLARRLLILIANKDKSKFQEFESLFLRTNPLNLKNWLWEKYEDIRKDALI